MHLFKSGKLGGTMKRLFQLVVFLLLTSGLLLSCKGGSSQNSGNAGDFLSWTGMDDQTHVFMLVRVNGKTGAVSTIGGTDYFPAMAYAPDGTLYGISDELHVIDPATGNTVKIGTFQYEASTILMHGAAFSPDGTLYVVENNPTPHRVFTVNLTNAALTYIGTPAALIWDLEFASDGTLYGAFADLFTLNAADLTILTTVGRMGPYVLPLTSDSAGTLFGMDIYPSTTISSLSPTTGSSSPIVATGSSGLNSLVVEGSSAVTSASVFHKAAAVHGLSSPRPLEDLLRNEGAIKAMRSTN
jgi:hypothetical protein